MNSSRTLGGAELGHILRKPQAIEEMWSSACPKVLNFATVKWGASHPVKNREIGFPENGAHPEAKSAKADCRVL
jgi:hypothetical protein